MKEINLLEFQSDETIADSFSIRGYNADHHITSSFFRSNYHRIFLIRTGMGKLQIDDEYFPLAAHQLLVIGKGQVFGFEDQSNFNGFELSFGDCFWERAPQSGSNCKAVLFNNAAANQEIKISEPDFISLETLFETLNAEFLEVDYINKPDALAAYLKIIMIKIANLNSTQATSYDSYDHQLFRNFMELVSQHYQNTHEVSDFAKQLGVSSRKLSEICRQFANTGAKDLINGQLTAEAKRLLQFSALPVKEIAFKLHFATPYHFSHFFKKNTLLPPQEYRERFVKIGM